MARLWIGRDMQALSNPYINGRSDTGGEHPLVRRLQLYVSLSEDDRRFIAGSLPPSRRLLAHDDLITESSHPGGTVVVLSGFTYRAKLMPDGRRQIVAYMMPGDFCDLHVGLLRRRMDHTITAATSATVCVLSPEAVARLVEGRPRVAQALRIGRLVDEAIMREWLVNLGLRTAFERMGALFCEVYLRLNAVGLVRNGQCDFHLTQSELAETLGLSAVHINRTLQELRRQGLICLSGRRLTIPDIGALMAASMFDPGYLHLDQKRS